MQSVFPCGAIPWPGRVAVDFMGEMWYSIMSEIISFCAGKPGLVMENAQAEGNNME